MTKKKKTVSVEPVEDLSPESGNLFIPNPPGYHEKRILELEQRLERLERLMEKNLTHISRKIGRWTREKIFSS